MCKGLTHLFYGTHVCDGACPEDKCPILDNRTTDNRERINKAKSVCYVCPVLGPCREWALTNPDSAEYGVAGGLSEAERRRLIRIGVRDL